VSLPQARDRPAYVRAMFARIAGRYDLLNDLMTAGLHRRWKRAAVRAAQPAGALALDLGCGTGDLSRELARQEARIVVGADFVPQMLAAARDRTAARGTVVFAVADALALPFADTTFDCVTSGFLVRNVADAEHAFREMRRVLKPGGRVVCLDAARRDGPFGQLLSAGFGLVARTLGRLVAGDPEAYAYLSASAAAFASPAELAATMQRAGLRRIQYRTFAFGLVAVHRGVAECRDSGFGIGDSE
jgi:demethylmenaquinone methyltransferase/2-methoxy-6-polyprenyl-1,4-benzoquinol methylase